MAWLGQFGEVEGGFQRQGETSPSSRSNFDLRAQPAPVYGLALDWAARPSVALRLAGSFAATEFALAGAVVDARGIQDLSELGGLGRLYVSTVDVALLWKLAPPRRAVVPYAVLGAGATVYDLNDPGDFEIQLPLTGVRLADVPRTEVAPALTVGLGADLRLGRGPSVRLEASNHLSTGPLSDFDFDTSTNPDFVGGTDGAELVHQFQFTVGVSFPIGR